MTRRAALALVLFVVLIATLIWLSRRALGQRLSISGHVMTCGYTKDWPAGSQLVLNLVERGSGRLVALAMIEPVPADPVPFEIFYFEGQIDPNGTYSVNGYLANLSGNRRCGTLSPLNVITRGAPTRNVVVRLGTVN